MNKNWVPLEDSCAEETLAKKWGSDTAKGMVLENDFQVYPGLVAILLGISFHYSYIKVTTSKVHVAVKCWQGCLLGLCKWNVLGFAKTL